MIDNNELMKKLTKDANRLQNKIEHRKLYNIRNAVVRSLIKSGIAVDYALPFIIVAMIIANAQTSKGNAPFRVDEIVEKAGIETIDTSSGIHLEHLSYDFDYDDELIEYSTGWIVNEQGLYERTVTSYRLNDDIDLENKEKILEMTKDDIDNALGYIVLVLSYGNNVRLLEKIFVKTYMRDKLREYEPSFRKINKEELDTMKKILKMKQENLSMLNNDNNSSIDGYSYKLRRI